MSTVRISRKTALNLRGYLWALQPQRGSIADDCLAALDAALKPKQSKPIAVASRKAKAAKKLGKHARWREVRDAVYERAGGYCECGCAKPFVGFRGARTPDHFFGKARAESIETVWALRVDCHERKTLNEPSAEHWRDRFVLHCERHGYHEAAQKARALTERDLLVLQAAEISARSSR